MYIYVYVDKSNSVKLNVNYSFYGITHLLVKFYWYRYY